MKTRMDLHRAFKNILGEDREKVHTYFQPADGTIIKYPAIVYQIGNVKKMFADDTTYIYRNAYTVTVMDKDPESEIAEKLKGWPLCSFDRFFCKDNLNQWVFMIYY